MGLYCENLIMRGKASSHTGSFFNSYDQRTFTQAQVTAKEAGQNSRDAGKKIPGVTQMSFHEITFTGTNKQKFIDIIGLNFLKDRTEAMSSRQENLHFVESVNNFFDKKSFKALLIRDFKACGLGGKWDDPSPGNHFNRLVCQLNLDDKADNEDTLGSFGLGKTVYAKGSDIRTVIYHSTFEETPESDGEKRRLMATGIYPRHDYQGQKFSGFSFFGEEYQDGNDSVAKPLSNEKAKDCWESIWKLADQADRLERKDNEYGTDVLILDCNVDLAEIKRAVEDYFFPAILSGQIECSFVDSNNEMSFAAPSAREDLDQFVRLWENAKNKAVNDSFKVNTENNQTSQLRRQKVAGFNLGAYSFEEAEPDEANDETKANRVALIRDPEGMVNDYVKVGSEKFETAVGVFVAHKDIKDILLISENPAHSEWSPEAYRLGNKYPVNGPKVVSAVNTGIRNKFQNFQSSLQPPVETSRSKTGFMSKQLSRLFTGRPGEEPVPSGEPKPFATSLRRVERESDHSEWRLKISDNEHTDDGCIYSVLIKPSISVRGESKTTKVKKKEFSITQVGGDTSKGLAPTLEIDMKKGDEFDFDVNFADPGDYAYIVKCDFVVSKTCEGEVSVSEV